MPTEYLIPLILVVFSSFRISHTSVPHFSHLSACNISSIQRGIKSFQLEVFLAAALARTERFEYYWFQFFPLFQDHIQEVLDKWTQIDDEIWAKVIVLERNRRVAKAYARAPVLTVNGSDDGFDGFR